MKICAFSDIHGNAQAFQKAFPLIRNERADLYLYLGDLCGYYYDQESIWSDLVTLPNLVALCGNHDRIFLRIARGDEALRREYVAKYGRSMENLLTKDHADLMTWLAGLPTLSTVLEIGLTAAHGSPWEPEHEYIYPDASLDRFLGVPSDLILLGHTHYPMNARIGNKTIVNPGSLGQPRNGAWPSYAVLDTEDNTVNFRNVPYERDEIIRQISRIDGDHPYLREVLYR